jgi:enoyl-CoA hydratase/carnithine racemase
VYETVSCEWSDGITTITLNRPDRKNAFNARMLEECRLAFEQAGRDPESRVIVLTGAGDYFSSGGDVADMGREISATDQKALLWEKMQAIPRTVERIDQPVIAMMNGDAIGGGLDVALMCDIRIAADHVKMSEAYVRLGLVPGDGGAYFMPRIVGMSRALELLLTGDFIDANEAARIGLISRAVPADRLREDVYALASRIASRPPLAVRLTKRLAYQGLRSDLSGALDAASSHVIVMQLSDDHKEAVQAFRDKRKGVYKGR